MYYVLIICIIIIIIIIIISASQTVTADVHHTIRLVIPRHSRIISLPLLLLLLLLMMMMMIVIMMVMRASHISSNSDPFPGQDYLCVPGMSPAGRRGRVA